MARKPLTEADTEQIVALKLEQVSVLDIAKIVGVNKNTVTKHWQDWLDQTTVERREQLERKRSEMIVRLGDVARRARTEEAETPADRARFLAEERQAWRALSTIAGFDAPTKVQLASFDAMTEEEARAGLDKL